jgi:hypothetical protein
MDLEDARTRVRFVVHDGDAGLTAASGEVFGAAGARMIRAAVQAPRMDPVMERRAGGCCRGLPGRALVRDQRHLMIVLREYGDCCSTRRPRRALEQAGSCPAASPAWISSGSGGATALGA